MVIRATIGLYSDTLVQIPKTDSSQHDKSPVTREANISKLYIQVIAYNIL